LRQVDTPLLVNSVFPLMSELRWMVTRISAKQAIS